MLPEVSPLGARLSLKLDEQRFGLVIYAEARVFLLDTRWPTLLIADLKLTCARCNGIAGRQGLLQRRMTGDTLSKLGQAKLGQGGYRR